ncbi:MAG: hypothetical protein WKF37_00010 [Bryobacteraceae bacterium]
MIRHLIHERRIQILALSSGFPAVAIVLILLLTGDYPARVQWTLSLFVIGCWLGFAAAARERVAAPLRTLANLLEAMREGDYSIRARDARGDDSLGEVMQQVNARGATLRAQRLGALEATTLLRKVMEEIDVVIFAFDANRRLRLVNRAGERLLAQPSERILGLPASEIRLKSFSKATPCTLRYARFRKAPGAGASAAVLFAKAGFLTSYWFLPISQGPYGKRNYWHGSGSCAYWDMS